ncbi:MAG: SAM-dependent methyltransferase, partial [Bacteroidales bacterium]|nr:SAM-dependent methyltransferase [Bacteroidales bacterium]
PGRQFRIVNHFHFNKKEAAKHLSGIKKANIAVRNFPWSAEELRKQLNLADGGGLYLFGATMREGELGLIVGEK